LYRGDCEAVVNKELAETDFEGNPDEILTAKLRCTRNALKEWWKRVLEKEGKR